MPAEGELILIKTAACRGPTTPLEIIRVVRGLGEAWLPHRENTSDSGKAKGGEHRSPPLMA